MAQFKIKNGVAIIPEGTTEIGEYAFDSCKSLTSATIPDSVTSIGGYAFRDCSSLTSITIPDSVTSIENGAFSGCNSLPVIDNVRYADTCVVGVIDKTLSSYTIKDNTRLIGNYTFYNCSNLTSVTIPDSVTSIGDFAFYGCTSLTSVTIGNGVTSIGRRVFGKCCGSISAYCKVAIPPTVYSGPIYDASAIKIYVPRQSVEAYKAAEYWSEYASDIEGYDF